MRKQSKKAVKQREQIIDLTQQKTVRRHPEMSTTPANTHLREIPRGPSFTKDRRAEPISLTKEQEEMRARKQTAENRQFQIDNPKLRGCIASCKPTKQEIKTAYKNLDAAASVVLDIKRRQLGLSNRV